MILNILSAIFRAELLAALRGAREVLQARAISGQHVPVEYSLAVMLDGAIQALESRE